VPVEAILFDFNGVIIDDEPLHLEAFRELLAPLGITFTDDEYYGPLLGIPDSEFMRRLLLMRGRAMAADELARLLTDKAARYMQLLGERDVDLPGLPQCVRDLAAHMPLGVVSGARRPEIEFHLQRLKLADCFRFVLAAGEYPRTKPDPAPYLYGRAGLEKAVGRRLSPARTVVIEDSPHGVASGIAAGMPVLGFTARVPAAALPGCFAYLHDFTGFDFAALTAAFERRPADSSR